MNQTVILASQSPRRKELLKQVLPAFDVEAADIDEEALQEKIMNEADSQLFMKRAKALVEGLAYEKARTILEKHPDALVIGADTVVVHNDKVLGKPANEEEAWQMLRSYAGTIHSVLTGFSIVTKKRTETRSVETTVCFFDWNEQMEKEMREYIASGSPLDKAGAYGIQEKAGLWVAEIHGDYPNVIGLPIAYVNQVLQTFREE